MFLWVPTRHRGNDVYRIERDHPVLRAVAGSCSDRQMLDALIRLLEETIPTPLIAMKESERPTEQAAPLSGVRAEEIRALMTAAFRAMLGMGQSPSDARRRLAFIEPFDRFPELLETFVVPDRTEEDQADVDAS